MRGYGLYMETTQRETRIGPRDRAARRRAALADTALVVVLIAVLWGNVLRQASAGGFVLLRDAVSTPDPPLSDAALGIGPYAARAVPQDVTMWALQAVFRAVGLPESLVLPLLVTLALALLGAAARAWVLAVVAPRPYRGPHPTHGTVEDHHLDPAPLPSFFVRAPAICMALWNPFVVERLLQGHWSLILAAAAASWLPLFLLTATHAPAFRRSAPAVTGLVALCAFVPTGLLLAGGMLLGALVGQEIIAHRAARAGRVPVRSRGLLALGFATFALAALPVVVATVLGWGGGGAAASGVAGAAGAAAGVDAFAARAEPGLGTLGSLLSLGGIWNAQAVPPSRSGWATALLSLPLLASWVGALAILVLRVPAGGERARAWWALGMAWSTIAAAALAATGPGRALLGALVEAVPAAGMLRDGQKFVALALPGAVVAVALCAQWVYRRINDAQIGGRHSPFRAAAALMVAVPLLSVPDAAQQVATQYRTTVYGPGWQQINEILAAADGVQQVLVLPGGSFRSDPHWAGGRPVLDPAPRLLHAEVLATGDLRVGGLAVTGEGTSARAAEQALLDGRPAGELAALGPGWVVHERSSRGRRGHATETLQGAELRFRDDRLELWELPRPTGDQLAAAAAHADALPTSTADGRRERDRTIALAAHALWATLLAGALITAVAGALCGAAPGSRGRRDLDDPAVPAPGGRLGQ